MRHHRLIFAVVLLLVSALPALGQDSIDNVVVTGDVTNIVLCHHDNDAWIYRLSIRLHVKNVGKQPLIISAASAMTDYYKVATTPENLSAKTFSHIGWVTSGGPSEPSPVPGKPVRPFKVVTPNESIDIEVDLRAIVTAELKPGSAYLQIVAENWPDYTDEYIAKLKRAWSSYGVLWAHSLHSHPISFTVPLKVRAVRCP
ncbi:MAG TPA: hypothetical protein VGV87_03380 [Blastocatellia bacterium]|jgi:hypothetical protein|nr:hypothetical protein [Blastocatellia bacterium]